MKHGTEDQHAQAFVEAFAMQHPQHAGKLIHISNEGGVTASKGARFAHAAKRKRMGLIPGVSDYFLAYPFEDLHGLWLELKAPGGAITRAQAAFLEVMRAAGYAAACAWGWEAAMHIAGRYLRGNIDSRHAYGAEGPTGMVPLSQLTLHGTPRIVTICRTKQETAA